VDRDLGLQLTDPLLRRRELYAFTDGDPCFFTTIDTPLAPPRTHGLLADPEIRRDVSDAPAALDELQHPLMELRRIGPSSHAVLLKTASESKNRTRPNPGTPEPPSNPVRMMVPDFCELAAGLSSSLAWRPASIACARRASSSFDNNR
jgi:hypothetical protein